MSLSHATLSAIQQAGAAVFDADLELKHAVRRYAERVNVAMGSNPYHLGNDAMFENWKVVARLSQTMAGIEDELKKVYQVATDLLADDFAPAGEVPALGAPTRSVEPAARRQDDMTATDVVAKTGTQTLMRKTRAAKASPARARPARVAGQRPALGGNATKLLNYMESMLDTEKFTVIGQATIAQATGIPLGSMTAGIKKLLASGRLVAGPTGSFKLA